MIDFINKIVEFKDGTLGVVKFYDQTSDIVTIKIGSEEKFYELFTALTMKTFIVKDFEIYEYLSIKYGVNKMFKDIDDAGGGECFYHFAEIENVIKIIKDGKFLARNYNSEIPYDNVIKNETSSQVMSGTCKEMSNFVRFYLNKFNKTFYNMNFNTKNLAIITINREIIAKVDRPIIIFPKNGYKACSKDLSFDKRINQLDGYDKLINRYDIDFNKIYEKYNWTQGALYIDTTAQQAECLIEKSISIEFIQNIIFKTQEQLDYFLNKIKTLISNELYIIIYNKCLVKIDMF